MLHDRRFVLGGEPSPSALCADLGRGDLGCGCRLPACHRTDLQCPLTTSLIRQWKSSHIILAGGPSTSTSFGVSIADHKINVGCRDIDRYLSAHADFFADVAVKSP